MTEDIKKQIDELRLSINRHAYSLPTDDTERKRLLELYEHLLKFS